MTFSKDLVMPSYVASLVNQWENKAARLRLCRKALSEIRNAPAHIKVRQVDIRYWTKEEDHANDALASIERQTMIVLARYLKKAKNSSHAPRIARARHPKLAGTR